MDLGLKNSKICRFLRKSSKFYASCSPDSCAGIINYFDNENQPFKLLKTMEVFQDTEQSLSLQKDLLLITLMLDQDDRIRRPNKEIL